MPLQGDDRKRHEPSYAVIEWNDGTAGRQQAVFEFPQARLGTMNAGYVKLMKEVPGLPLRRAGA